MKDSSNDISSFRFDLPELSIQLFSFIELAVVIVAAGILYYLMQRMTQTLRSLGVLEKNSSVYKLVNIANFAIPGFLGLYGLTSVSRGSLLISLIFAIVISIVIGFALIDPIRSMLSSLLIQVKGEVKPGDYINIGDIEGRILNIGLFNLNIETPTGSRVYIPISQTLRQSFEVDAQVGGPTVTIEIDGDFAKKRIEDLTVLCPYRKDNTKIQVLQTEGEKTQVHFEVIQRNSKPWIQKYFKNYLNSKTPKKRFF